MMDPTSLTILIIRNTDQGQTSASLKIDQYITKLIKIKQSKLINNLILIN